LKVRRLCNQPLLSRCPEPKFILAKYVPASTVAAIQSNKSTPRTDLEAIFLRAHQIENLKSTSLLILQIFCRLLKSLLSILKLVYRLQSYGSLYKLSLADIVKNRMCIYSYSNYFPNSTKLRRNTTIAKIEHVMLSTLNADIQAGAVSKKNAMEIQQAVVHHKRS
jgi:hypothetical protein